MSLMKIRNSQGEFENVIAIKGEKGDPGVSTFRCTYNVTKGAELLAAVKAGLLPDCLYTVNGVSYILQLEKQTSDGVFYFSTFDGKNGVYYSAWLTTSTNTWRNYSTNITSGPSGNFVVITREEYNLLPIKDNSILYFITG